MISSSVQCPNTWTFIHACPFSHSYNYSRNLVRTKKTDELLQLSVSQQTDANEFSPAPSNHSTAPVVVIWIWWITFSKSGWSQTETRRDLTSDLLSDSHYRHRVAQQVKTKTEQRLNGRHTLTSRKFPQQFLEKTQNEPDFCRFSAHVEPPHVWRVRLDVKDDHPARRHENMGCKCHSNECVIEVFSKERLQSFCVLRGVFFSLTTRDTTDVWHHFAFGRIKEFRRVRKWAVYN